MRYQAWQDSVIACLGDADIDVPSGELTQMARPFLQRLLDLAGSEYTTKRDGSIEYEFSATQAARIPQRRSAR